MKVVVDHRWDDLNSVNDADRFKYGYDRNSNRTYRENVSTSGLDELYSYDKLNRLTQVGRGTLNGTKDGFGPADETFRQTWGLNDLGNWDTFKEYSGIGLTLDLDQTRAHNAVNEIDTTNDHGDTKGDSITASPGVNWFDPTYDAAGNMTAFPKPADPANGYTAVYDAWNRLVEVKDGANTVAKYEYDGVGRRIVKEEYDTPGTVKDRDRHYYYTVGWQVVEERIDTNTLADQQFVWGLWYIDDLVLRDRDAAAGGNLGVTSSGLDERLYALYDSSYNVTTVINTGGDAVERYRYTPYGERTVLKADFSLDSDGQSDYDWEIGHQGLVHDIETGLISNRLRVLASHLGRWMQREPLGYVDGMNLYQYVLSNPVKYIDPSGLQAAPAPPPVRPSPLPRGPLPTHPARGNTTPAHFAPNPVSDFEQFYQNKRSGLYDIGQRFNEAYPEGMMYDPANPPMIPPHIPGPLITPEPLPELGPIEQLEEEQQQLDETTRFLEECFAQRKVRCHYFRTLTDGKLIESTFTIPCENHLAAMTCCEFAQPDDDWTPMWAEELP